ncbi:MAG: hypothetical protein RLY20_3550 [Verrucomicrobiota bacterium]|jgi:hypothetical protein
MNLLFSNQLRRTAASFALFAFASWLLVGLTGCQSGTEPGSQSHAVVQIKGHSLAEIQTATTAVFTEAGYWPKLAQPDQMMFERPGSRRDAVKWGNIAGGGVNMRVKVLFSVLPNGNQLLQADAYAVQVSDDPFFQTESRNVLLNRRPYQKLLDQVVARLK